MRISENLGCWCHLDFSWFAWLFQIWKEIPLKRFLIILLTFEEWPSKQPFFCEFEKLNCQSRSCWKLTQDEHLSAKKDNPYWGRAYFVNKIGSIWWSHKNISKSNFDTDIQTVPIRYKQHRFRFQRWYRLSIVSLGSSASRPCVHWSQF